MPSGYMIPVIRVMTMIIMIAGRNCFDIGATSREPDGGDQKIDQFDTGKRDGNPSETINEQIPAQDAGRAHGAIRNTLQRQRNQRDDDKSIENDRGQDRAL